MPLDYDDITATQKFTTPPPRYTEASLVKNLRNLVSEGPQPMHPQFQQFRTGDMFRVKTDPVKNDK
jgi:DNA topoisomerase IA